MTKKHFEHAATIVKNSNPKHKKAIAESFAEFFQSFNPAFQRERFFTACGL